MALFRQGSGGVSVQGTGAGTAARSYIGRKYNIGNRRRLRGVTLKPNISIVQCAIVVFFFILITVSFLIASSSFPFAERGDLQISQKNRIYNKDHSVRRSLWKLKSSDDSLSATDKQQWIRGSVSAGVKEKPLSHAVNNDVQERKKVLEFGNGSVDFGRDSRYWDKDDRRRDGQYDGEYSSISETDSTIQEISTDTDKAEIYVKNSSFIESEKSGQISAKVDKSIADRQSVDQDGETIPTKTSVEQNIVFGGFYNEKGRNELKIYEAQYEASLAHEHIHNDTYKEEQNYLDDEYDDGIDDDYIHLDENEPFVTEQNAEKQIKSYTSVNKEPQTKNTPQKEALAMKKHDNEKKTLLGNKVEKESSLLLRGFYKENAKKPLMNNLELVDFSRNGNTDKRKMVMRKGKRHKHRSVTCEPKFLNSTSLLVEPEENSKFSSFSLEYVESEETVNESDHWVPRFAGHQTLEQREASFLAYNKKLHCGFVKRPNGSSTGFDLSTDDAEFLNTCHIAVSSCIFGNSDKLRTPTGRKVTGSSKKHVCFVMFVDETTLKTMAWEGREPDDNGYIGLWKIVVVKHLPYPDMRRTGKVPKFLTHRLFPSARYSIWLDSKLRLQSDPLLILEYFLWRHGFEYAISNHYDRHCVWEEVEQNKRLNKFNHTVIDEQFKFYQKDGLTRFNSSDPNRLLPSYVPEGSFIVRAHTPMSNLFSCLWFNEVDRFTPRDQLSFAYTYLKFQRMNPKKHFYLHMFKDCERRRIAKLFRHRTDSGNHDALQSTG